MQKILIVEDEKKLARYLQLELTHEGYEIRLAHDGRAAIAAFEEWPSDLILLDLMLPELSGIEVCRRIRQKSGVPIIMLTAKDDVSDKVMGLDMDADDYMTKPFAIEELLARIRVALKRHGEDAAHAGGERTLAEGALSLDRDSREVSYGGAPIQLTKKEFDLLEYLMLNRNVAISRHRSSVCRSLQTCRARRRLSAIRRASCSRGRRAWTLWTSSSWTAAPACSS